MKKIIERMITYLGLRKKNTLNKKARKIYESYAKNYNTKSRNVKKDLI